MTLMTLINFAKQSTNYPATADIILQLLSIVRIHISNMVVCDLKGQKKVQQTSGTSQIAVFLDSYSGQNNLRIDFNPPKSLILLCPKH